VPAWVWLGGLVVLSTVVRYGLGRRVIAPWIFVDEIIYSELAKSFAETGEFVIRGDQDGSGYGVFYPLLISPAYALFDSLPGAYAAAKAINALLMSLAAVPVYLLARRVLEQPLALAAALLSLALPGLFYSGVLMTENAFYGLFVLAALMLVLVLELPSPGRVVAFLVVAGVAFFTRTQALVLLPALATAPPLVVACRRQPLRRLADYRWLYALPGAAAVVVAAAQAMRGRPLLDLLGAYRVAGEVGYDLEEAARWLLYHLAGLDLAVGFLPLAALLLLPLVGRLEPRDAAFVAAALSLTGWTVVQVAVFASRHSLRIEERNLFYVFPLLLIALLVWIERGAPRPRVPTALALAVAVVLPAFVPYERLVGVPAVSDTFALLVLWDVHLWGVPLDQLWLATVLGALVAALLFVLVPRPYALALPVLVLAFFLFSAGSVEKRIRDASIGALFQGVTRPERDWVDRAVGQDTRVAVLWSGRLDVATVYENEFFSRSVGRVYSLGPPMGGGLVYGVLAVEGSTGRLLDADRRPVRMPYALVDDTVPLAGGLVDRDRRKGLRVLRTPGVLHVTHQVDGVYDDGWTGANAIYVRYDCRGGTLRVVAESDPKLFRRRQTIVARVGGRVAARTRIPPDGVARVSVPLRPRAGRCSVAFHVSPTAVPGPGDSRRLGTHLRRLDYVAPR
jgi:hypothetical protein